MDFLQKLKEHLSEKDFIRMQSWLGGLADAERAEVMQFIFDRETRAPAVGDEAPDFDLPLLDGSGRVRLSTFRGDRPVALIFGSYT